MRGRLVVALAFLFLLIASPLVRPLVVAHQSVASGHVLPGAVRTRATRSDAWTIDASLELPPIPASNATQDWTSYGSDARGTHAATLDAGITNDDAGGLREAWRAPMGAVSGEPMVSNGSVFVADMNGNVTALDITTGRAEWRRDVGAPVSGTTAIGDGRVFAVTLMNATLHALDAASGVELWAEPIAPTSAGWGSPIVASGLVIVGASGGDDGYAPPDHRGSVQAFDARSGALVWRTFVADPGSPGSSVWTTPVVAGGLVVVGTGNPNAESDPHADAIVALRIADGNIAWSRSYFPQGDHDTIDDDFGSSPVVYETQDHGLVIGEAQKYGPYHIVNASTGEVLGGSLLVSSDIIGSPAVGDGCVFLVRDVTYGSAEVDCLSEDLLATPRWMAHLGGSYSSPAAAPGVVFVADGSGTLEALSSADGSVLWRTTLPGGTDSSPVIAEGRVLIGYQAGWGPGKGGGIVAYAPIPESARLLRADKGELPPDG